MDAFVSEIRIMGFDFAPAGWAQCNGQLVPVSQNTALFALLGTIYGGNGQTTFALPDLQERVPMFWGQGDGLSQRSEGESGGENEVTLKQAEMPMHTHSLMGDNQTGDTPLPAGHTLARYANAYQTNTSQKLTTLSAQAVESSGKDQPHNNIMPSLVVNFCIALSGLFPERP